MPGAAADEQPPRRREATLVATSRRDHPLLALRMPLLLPLLLVRRVLDCSHRWRTSPYPSRAQQQLPRKDVVVLAQALALVPAIAMLARVPQSR